MINNEDNRGLLDEYLNEYGLHLKTEQMFCLLEHLDLVAEKNKVLNLTRITDAEDAIVRHIVDSLLLLPSIETLNLSREATFVDIGTGAGFPGIPIAIVTEYHGLLIDSVGKKVRAVQEFIQELGLDRQVAAQSIRAEDLARSALRSYDFVTARAVADLGVLIEYAAPLLKRQGALVVSKGRIDDDELRRGDKTADIVGLERVSRETYELPHDTGHREILTYKKIKGSKIKLPRQTGMAKHKPLAS